MWEHLKLEFVIYHRLVDDLFLPVAAAPSEFCSLSAVLALCAASFWETASGCFSHLRIYGMLSALATVPAFSLSARSSPCLCTATLCNGFVQRRPSGSLLSNVRCCSGTKASWRIVLREICRCSCSFSKIKYACPDDNLGAVGFVCTDRCCKSLASLALHSLSFTPFTSVFSVSYSMEGLELVTLISATPVGYITCSLCYRFVLLCSMTYISPSLPFFLRFRPSPIQYI